MAVKVQFQIGHTSKLRSKKTVEGFTHDWELYVRGVQQADISAFVEKIIFNLHESFQKPKRVCNKPPYVIQESGYAGFLVFIDIYFRNRDEPKKVQFNYDLDLQQTGPPQHRHDIKTFIFDNPSEEYRQKLLKGGGVPVSGVVAGSQPTINNNIATMPTAVNINHQPGEGHKALSVESKKHKSRPEDTRSNSFANLFGTPITKSSAVLGTTATKHSPDNKTAIVAAHASHQPSVGTSLSVVKEKSKDKEKYSEKSKERPEKREKHHKQSLTSPYKEGRSESKKSDGNKHEKRDKTEEKSKKDKSRDKERERDRDKSSGANSNNSSSASKRPISPKPAKEHSPHKSITTGVASANAIVNNANSAPRPSSSNSGKLEEVKTSSKSSKDLSTDNKSKESKQKESSSSSSGKKSKKEKKDKDKERDKEKRHEDREKQKLAENQQRSNAKEDGGKVNNINSHTNNTNSLDNKNSKTTANPLNASNDIGKKPEKLTKQEVFKTSSEKIAPSNTSAPPAVTSNSSSHSSADKKSSSSSSLNSNSNPSEKDKRSHKHKKKEKNKDKDKDKDRERDKERDKDKDKDKERDKDKDKEKEKEKEVKREKETKEKHAEEKTAEPFSLNSQTTNATKALLAQAVNTIEQPFNSLNTSAPSTTAATTSAPYTTVTTTTAIASSSSSTTSIKSSKNKDRKSKDKSSAKEEKVKRKTNDIDTSESKTKQAKLSSNSVQTPSSLSTSSSSSSVSTSIASATINPPNTTQPAVTAIASKAAEINLNLDLSDTDSLPTASVEQMAPLPNSSSTKPSLEPTPIITHSESSNSSFPDLQLSKQQTPTKSASSRERSKAVTTPAAVAPTAATAPLLSSASKEPPKAPKSAAKEKSVDKPPKEEEKEKKKRRNSQAVNTFIEPPLKQLKAKEQSKTIREKSKSPSLRNTGTRASISTEASNTFLQPSASPSSTAAAVPLPPPSSAPPASHSPALSAAEAVGNATSATANAATCNSNSTPSSTNSAVMAAPHQLPLDYLSELQELHHKIMTLQDNEDLQHVVELIAATGCYEITTKTFDFDLCKLDRSTVQRLQEFFATSVS